MPNEASTTLAKNIQTRLSAVVDSLAFAKVAPTSRSVILSVTDPVERRAVITGINEAGKDYKLNALAEENALGEIVVAGKNLPEELLPTLLRASYHNIRDHIAIEKSEEFDARRSILNKKALDRAVMFDLDKEQIRIIGNPGDRATLLNQMLEMKHPLLQQIKDIDGISLTIKATDNLLSYIEITSQPGKFSALLAAADRLAANVAELREVLDQRPDRHLASAPEIEITGDRSDVTIMPTITVDPVAYLPGKPSTLNPPPKPRRG